MAHTKGKSKNEIAFSVQLIQTFHSKLNRTCPYETVFMQSEALPSVGKFSSYSTGSCVRNAFLLV